MRILRTSDGARLLLGLVASVCLASWSCCRSAFDCAVMVREPLKARCLPFVPRAVCLCVCCAVRSL